MYQVVIEFRDAYIETEMEKLTDLRDIISETIPNYIEYAELYLGEPVRKAHATISSNGVLIGVKLFSFYRQKLSEKLEVFI